MIECKHKHVMPVLNQGIYSEFCMLHRTFVNDSICNSCSDKEGTLARQPTAYEFPRRNDQEIEQIHKVCEGCPLFNKLPQTCKKMTYNPQPTDIIAQNPSNHCPEGEW